MASLAATDKRQVVVKIGDIPVRLLTEDQSFLSLIEERYSSFVSSDHAADIYLTLDLMAPGRISQQDDLRVVRTLRRWRAERGDFRFDWDSENGGGKIRQSANPYSLDAVLRILHSLLLARRKGFLLHAASAVRNGRAFLFFGPSGAGKTTISRLAPPDVTLLTDEISYVRRDSDGYLAYGTPFTGELAKLGENTSAPVAGCYRLIKASKNRVQPLPPTRSVEALLESVLFFAEDPELVNLVFQSICDFACALPVYRLEFVPEQSVWDLIQ